MKLKSNYFYSVMFFLFMLEAIVVMPDKFLASISVGGMIFCWWKIFTSSDN